MKKILFLLLLFILCGCTYKDEYDSYEHYDLRNYNHKIYSYLRVQEKTNNIEEIVENEKYAVSLLIPRDQKEVMGYEEGILYEVASNDYILLDSFSGDDKAYQMDIYTRIYKDKLYILRSSNLYEYTLDKENTKKRELKFDYSSILKINEKNYLTLFGRGIKNIDDDYIYFEDVYISNLEYIDIKCSLKNNKCEEYNK